MDPIRRTHNDPTIQKDAVQRLNARRRPRGEDGHDFGEELEKHGDDAEGGRDRSGHPDPETHDDGHPRPRGGDVGNRLDVTG